MAGRTKKITNFNAMRKVICIAHNDGNNKAISKDMVTGANIDQAYFDEWKKDVEALRVTVNEYTVAKHNVRIGVEGATKQDAQTARNRIFPKWKAILAVGEETQGDITIHVDEWDVEDLIGYATEFKNIEGKGTVVVPTGDTKFRKYVETLLGCIIAKNVMLTDEERDTLNAYESASQTVQNCIDKTAELKLESKSLKEMLKKVQDSNENQFVAFLTLRIKECDDAIKSLANTKKSAQDEQSKHSAAAEEIKKKVQSIKITK